jgi:hypothetical protein
MDLADPECWIVVLEAEADIDHRSVDRLLQVLADLHPVALHCPGRYGVQLQITAAELAEALYVALSRLRSALGAVGQPATAVVRAEVLCREEFESDCRRAYGDAAMPRVAAGEQRERQLRTLN